MPIGGYPGLLAGLGFAVSEQILDSKGIEPITEKILKWTTRSQMIHVYDFRKKYRIF